MPDPALPLVQETLEALNEAITTTPNPEFVDALTTCQSQIAAVQRKMMAEYGQSQQGPPAAGMAGAAAAAPADPREAIMALLSGGGGF